MARHHQQKPARASVWKTLLYMIGMGIACAWLTALGYPLWIKMHISQAVASKLPSYALFAGLGLGLGIGLFPSMREVFKAIGAMALLGAVFWFFGVLLGGLLIGFGVPDSVASWAPRVGFGLGVLLGGVLLYAIAQDRWDALRARVTGKPRPSES